MAQEESDHHAPPQALTPNEAEAQVRGLRRIVERHNHLYYVEARPEISDGEYDALFRRLTDLEEAFPDLITPESPTQRVGAGPQEYLPTIRHTAPMLSLDSTKDEGDLIRFDQRVRKALGESVRYLVEPKLDGASVELVYEDGVLTRAVTRGNGQEGEGVTENVRTIPSVPLRLRAEVRPVPPFLAVRGEVLMYLSEFRRLNQRLMLEGSDPFANPRNASAGALRQLDARITAQRPLDFLAFDILSVSGAGFREDREVVEALRDWGLKTPDRVRLIEDVGGILDYHRAFLRDRDDLDYEIDGIVIKLNELDAREIHGEYLPAPPLGVGIQVRTPEGGDPDPEHRGVGRADGSRDTGGPSPSRGGGWSDGLPSFLAQPGGGGPKGHSRGRSGADSTCRGCDTAGSWEDGGGGTGTWASLQDAGRVSFLRDEAPGPRPFHGVPESAPLPCPTEGEDRPLRIEGSPGYRRSG